MAAESSVSVSLANDNKDIRDISEQLLRYMRLSNVVKVRNFCVGKQLLSVTTFHFLYHCMCKNPACVFDLKFALLTIFITV